MYIIHQSAPHMSMLVYIYLAYLVQGQFLDTTGTEWSNLGLKALATFSKNISSGDADSGIVSGYVSCSVTSLSNATLKVFTETITNKTSTIASETVSIGTGDTIYVIGIIIMISNILLIHFCVFFLYLHIFVYPIQYTT